MNKNTIGLMKGIGTGLAAGMMVGYVGSQLMSNQKQVKKKASKAAHAVGNLIDDVQYIFKGEPAGKQPPGPVLRRVQRFFFFPALFLVLFERLGSPAEGEKSLLSAWAEAEKRVLRNAAPRAKRRLRASEDSPCRRRKLQRL